MRISFDIDDTLACLPHHADEEHSKLPAFVHRWLGEPLRRGTRSLIRDLRRQGCSIWIYTSSGRTPAYIRRWLMLYGIHVDGVVNSDRHQHVLAQHRLENAPSKYPPAFDIDLHVDDSEGSGSRASTTVSGWSWSTRKTAAGRRRCWMRRSRCRRSWPGSNRSGLRLRYGGVSRRWHPDRLWGLLCSPQHFSAGEIERRAGAARSNASPLNSRQAPALPALLSAARRPRQCFRQKPPQTSHRARQWRSRSAHPARRRRTRRTATASRTLAPAPAGWRSARPG